VTAPTVSGVETAAGPPVSEGPAISMADMGGTGFDDKKKQHHPAGWQPPNGHATGAMLGTGASGSAAGSAAGGAAGSAGGLKLGGRRRRGASPGDGVDEK